MTSINAINNQNTAHKQAFGGCAILGSGAEKYMTSRIAKEAGAAVEEFKDFCNHLTNWGYVRLERTPQEDVFRLIGKDNFYSTKITADTRLDELKAKLLFLKERNAIIDQA